MSIAKKKTSASSGLRIVLDSNVYISAFVHGQGVPLLVWQHARRRNFQLLVSPAIIREVAQVLRRRFAWTNEIVNRHSRLIARTAAIVIPKDAVAIFTGTQEPDNRILECAIAGKADLIISGDRDLQHLKVYQTIPIIRPIDALRTLGG